MRRGDLYLAEFDGYGSEQSGVRPALIVQNNTGNTYSPTTLVCPITTGKKSNVATHVTITPNDSDIIKDSIILCEQVRVIDKARLRQKLGKINNEEKILEVNNKLRISLGISSKE